MALPKDHTQLDDPRLVRAAQRGDMAAFEELVARHRDKVYARCYIITHQEELALDLSQDTWVKAWQRIGSFQGESSFATWLTRIAINGRRSASGCRICRRTMKMAPPSSVSCHRWKPTRPAGWSWRRHAAA